MYNVHIQYHLTNQPTNQPIFQSINYSHIEHLRNLEYTTITHIHMNGMGEIAAVISIRVIDKNLLMIEVLHECLTCYKTQTHCIILQPRLFLLSIPLSLSHSSSFLCVHIYVVEMSIFVDY